MGLFNKKPNTNGISKGGITLREAEKIYAEKFSEKELCEILSNKPLTQLDIFAASSVLTQSYGYSESAISSLIDKACK